MTTAKANSNITRYFNLTKNLIFKKTFKLANYKNLL